MSDKARVIIHSAFVRNSAKTFVDSDGTERPFKVVRLPRDIVVNGTPVGGATFTARYGYPAPENPKFTVFTFKEGTLVQLSLPIRGADGKVETFARIGVTPDSLQKGLDDARSAYLARRYAKAREREEQDLPEDSPKRPKRFKTLDEAREVVDGIVALYRSRNIRCAKRELAYVLETLSASWDDIMPAPAAEAPAEEGEEILPDDPYDLTEHMYDDLPAYGRADER